MYETELLSYKFSPIHLSNSLTLRQELRRKQKGVKEADMVQLLCFIRYRKQNRRNRVMHHCVNWHWIPAD